MTLEERSSKGWKMSADTAISMGSVGEVSSFIGEISVPGGSLDSIDSDWNFYLFYFLPSFFFRFFNDRILMLNRIFLLFFLRFFIFKLSIILMLMFDIFVRLLFLSIC